MELCTTIISNISEYSEFWSAIAGALVGGLIAYFLQLKVLREGKKQREEDFKRSQQVLGHSLIYKIVIIYSNVRMLHNHLEDCLKKAGYSDSREKAWEKAWTFVLPVINLPNLVFFSSEEMSMLIALKDDEVFNSVLLLDSVHNTICDSFQKFQNEREILLNRTNADKLIGNVGQITLDEKQLLALQPQIIMVNTIIKQLFLNTEKGLSKSRKTLFKLHGLLQEKLKLAYKLTDV